MLSTLHRHCHIFEKVIFILSVSSNNENKLRVGLEGSVLARRKSRVRIPGQTSKRNIKENNSSAISSQQISGKNSDDVRI